MLIIDIVGSSTHQFMQIGYRALISWLGAITSLPSESKNMNKEPEGGGQLVLQSVEQKAD